MSQPGGSAASSPRPCRAGRSAGPARISFPTDRVPVLAWVTGAVFVAVELAVSGRYGFQQDELYFIVAGRHLAFGYVDQPPLVPLLTRVTDVLGVGPTAVRIIPALAGGAVVVMAARLAALFGAGRFGRVLAALATACAPIVIGATHLGNTTPLDLLAWAAVLLCVTTALLRHRPRWWLGARRRGRCGAGEQQPDGHAAGRARPRHPRLGAPPRAAHEMAMARAGIAAVIWAPNLIWQATHGWPQLAMASALHQQNISAADYLGGLPAQLVYLGLLVIPLTIAGFIRLWRTPELRFIAVATTVIVIYVLAWVPGKVYYSDGLAPAVLAAGSLAAERWIARARRPRWPRGVVIAAPLVGMAIILPAVLPILPASHMHDLPASSQHADLGDTVGWPQLTRAVAAQDAALVHAGQPPTSIFTGYYGEAAALDVLGTADRLPPVLSGHNAYWMWGPGRASDAVVLVVDALGELRPDFASCRLLTTYYAPYHVHNDWTNIQIGVCTGPMTSWRALWPHLRHYG